MAFTMAFLLVLPGRAVTQHMQGMDSMSPSRHSSAQVVDIVRDPADVPPPVGSRPATTVKVELTAVEVVGELDPATETTYRYWTFNGKVPAPMIRVRQGDTIEVTLHNSPTSHMVHSLDFHAAIGPGGGAALSQVVPGQQKTFTFQATTPGLFVYHCGTPMIADHIANGMYGLILVEPPGGLPRVDHEYYVMQGEIYTTAPKGKSGLQSFSEANLMKESPEYFVFNGSVDALTKQHPLKAETGQTVRIFFGDAGPNETSSFHVVGEILTRDYELGSLSSPPLDGVQTAIVPPGGAAVLELKAAMPGQFTFMDHAMARMAKGLVGTLDVKGEQIAALMHAGPATAVAGSPQPTTSGLSATAEIIGKGDVRPSPITPNVPPAAVAASHMSMAMHTDRSVAQAASSQIPAPSSVRNPKTGTHLYAPGTVQLDGCFTMAGEVPKLRLFHSPESYDLEPRPGLLANSPLAFAQNINKLVHITGRFDRNAHLYGGHWFVVESIDQLAPACDTRQSLTRLRSAAKEHVERAGAAPTGSRHG